MSVHGGFPPPPLSLAHKLWCGLGLLHDWCFLNLYLKTATTRFVIGFLRKPWWFRNDKNKLLEPYFLPVMTSCFKKSAYTLLSVDTMLGWYWWDISIRPYRMYWLILSAVRAYDLYNWYIFLVKKIQLILLADVAG